MNEDEALQAMIWAGHITVSPDGTYKLSEELHDMLQKMVRERPELYAEIFPDRLN